MKKLFFITTILAASFMVYGQTTVDRAMSVYARNIINTNFTTSFANTALRAPLASPTFTGTVTIPTPFTLGAVSVLPTGTELNFVDGVTSAIQTQIDLKAPIAAPSFTGVASFAGGISSVATVIEYTDSITLTATEIVGTDAGDVGHADGAILVTAPGAGFTLEFVSAFLIYDYSTAAYTGGADDAVIQVGVTGTQVTVTGAITGANLLEASGDKMLRLGSISTELVHADNGAISLNGTALTQPGTAAGVLRVHITYRKHTTGL